VLVFVAIAVFFSCRLTEASGYDSRTLFVPKDAAKKFTPFEGQVLPETFFHANVAL